jgi:hypothetical protein
MDSSPLFRVCPTDTSFYGNVQRVNIDNGPRELSLNVRYAEAK